MLLPVIVSSSVMAKEYSDPKHVSAKGYSAYTLKSAKSGAKSAAYNELADKCSNNGWYSIDSKTLSINNYDCRNVGSDQYRCTAYATATCWNFSKR